MYKAGWPFWAALARRGVTIEFRVDIEYDPEAGVYIASSPDLKGLVVEADTLDNLKREAEDCVHMLMQEYVAKEPTRVSPVIRFHDPVLA